jgi:hypothetical protein
MLRVPVTLSLALTVWFSANDAYAVIKLRAQLSNAGELPAVVVPTSSNGGPRPISYGTAIFEINDAQTQMTMWSTIHNIDFGGQTPGELNDNLTAAHIHASDAPDTLPPNPPTRGVVWGFLGAPDHDTTPNDIVVTPFANKAGAFVTSKWDLPEGNGGLATNIPRILTERSYLNYHTSQFGGGEIRGTLVIIPEPASVMLFVMGASLVFGTCRRRSR